MKRRTTDRIRRKRRIKAVAEAVQIAFLVLAAGVFASSFIALQVAIGGF